MPAPVNLSFETATAPGQPQGWSFSYLGTARQRANYAEKGLQLASLAVSGGAYGLPVWLTMQCASENRTAQTGPSEVVESIASGAARRFSRDGINFGILVEPSAFNFVAEQDIDQWPTGSAVVTPFALPSGRTENCEVSDADAGSILDKTDNIGLTPGARYTLSAWTWQSVIAGGVTSNLIIDPTAGGDVPRLDITTTDTDWVYRSNTDLVDAGSSSETIRCFPATTTTAAATGTTRYGFMQVEAREYPTSFYTDIAREPDVLFINDTSSVLWGDGYSALTIEVQMLFAEGEEAGDFYVMWIDADNHLRWDNGNTEFMLTVAGVEMVAGISATWSRDDVLTFVVDNNEATTSLTLTGGGGGASSEASIGVFPTNATEIYILGDDSGATEAFALRDLSWAVPVSGFEGFEWLSLDTFLIAPSLALFGAGSLITPLTFDAFEASDDAWDTAYATTIVGGIAAVFDLGTPTTTEDFETEWNESDGVATILITDDEWSDIAHGLLNDDRVRLVGTPPAPFDDSTLYYVVNTGTNVFGLSLTQGGSALTSAAAGSATWFKSHVAYITALSSPTVGDFHPGGGTDETFEAGSGEGWDTGYETTITGEVAAQFGGAAGPNSQSVEDFEAVSFQQTFTVTPSTDEIVAPSHGLVNGDEVTFESTGALPGGIQAEFTYIVATASTNRFTILVESGGSTVDITGTGTGVHRLVEDRRVQWTEEYV